MLRVILISVLCIHLVWCYGNPEPRGVGAFAYSDSTGNRYGGTYGLKRGEVVDFKGNIPPEFPVNYLYPDFDSFYPFYFRNLENVLQDLVGARRNFPNIRPLRPFGRFHRRAFQSNLEHQQIAYEAAKKAFDVTTNQAGFIQNYPYRFNMPRMPDFSGLNNYNPYFRMPPLSENSAFAGAAATPDFTHQVAAINPANPVNPNVNEVQYFSKSREPGYMSVSSSAYSSSSNVNGEVHNQRGAETTVNKNGKVTTYKVTS